PQGAVRLARTCAAGALLCPGLLVRLVDVGATLLGTRALARVRLVGDHDLVDQRFVVFAAEQRVGRGYRFLLFAVAGKELEIHRYAPFLIGVFDEGSTTTSPPSAPGTLPFTSSSPRSVSTRTTFR